MALDGIFLRCIKCELENSILNAKVDKVFQPSADEIIISLRTRNFGTKKLLVCTRANSPRLHFTEMSYENPSTPPMLCMLLRKRLGGATITALRQNGCDRILFIDFLATNEMGDKENLTLVIEIMAQYSNAILLSNDGKIIDALKRVDYSKSSVRLILPGIQYELPPSQDKLNIFESSEDLIVSRVTNTDAKNPWNALLYTIMGISPSVAKEIALNENLAGKISLISKNYVNGSTEFYLYKDSNGKPIDFSFMPLTHVFSDATLQTFETASSLLDTYYGERDAYERMTHKTADLRKTLTNLRERICRKTDNQKSELETCANREILRINAELINANLYKLKKGSSTFLLENYYDDNKMISIAVDPFLTPAQNSQKYFKEYKKTYTAEKKLTEQLETSAEELIYIDSVIDALSRAEGENDINSIREELIEQGYLRRHALVVKKNSKVPKQKKVPAMPPLAYETTDGYRVLVGRNNLQNDKLSLKTAAKLDMWLHTKDFPGSHVIIENIGGEVSDKAIEEAAVIAAVNSTASAAHKVPVDYTLVKNLKKPAGAKPGKVIYHTNYTIYVTPNKVFADERRLK